MECRYLAHNKDSSSTSAPPLLALVRRAGLRGTGGPTGVASRYGYEYLCRSRKDRARYLYSTLCHSSAA
eukprot:scaffold338919_cov29-Prasinocladus_malaysianus.AAC.1